MTSPVPAYAASWQTLLTLDRKSDEFTHLARRLLNDQRHHKPEVSRFTEVEAPELIELMESTILQHVNIPGNLKSTAFTILRELCSSHGRLPRSCLINGILDTQEEIPFAIGAYTDLWKREWYGGEVAVKVLRFASDDDKSRTIKRLCKEVLLWKRLNHPNILPFYGASMNQNQFSIVYPWMDNGNILSYTRRNPETNRLRLLIDVTSGLKFLHRMNLAHGNIRGSNILISNSEPPRALLGDFGLKIAVFDPKFSLTETSIIWTAPELLAPDNAVYQPSIASDVYALAMTIYEVLTGTSPFARRGKTELIRRVVLDDERPPRPMDWKKLGFTGDVWETLRMCWGKKTSVRPSIDAVSTCLNRAATTWVVDVPAFMLASKAGVSQVMNLKGDQAKDFANRLDETLDQIGISQPLGKTYLHNLQRLCGESGVLPASFMITEGFDRIDERPFICSRIADVYRATYKGQPVVAKALRIMWMVNSKNVHKNFLREVVGWKWLRHENILPFVGVASVPLSFSTVSVWMENGDIMRFLRTTPNHNPFSLLVDATSGLEYLHQHDFVHGDLKGANILINSERRACLADFGPAAIIEDASSGDGPNGQATGGTTRWMAPEILDPDRFGYTKRSRRMLPSKSTDIYALGMTILEVATGRRPFEHVGRDEAVRYKVLTGNRPSRPTVGFSDPLWVILVQTWLELQYEAQTWSSTNRLLAPPMQMDRKASSTSSIGSFALPDQIVGLAEFGDAAPVDSGEFNSEFSDILRDIDEIIDPAGHGDHSGTGQSVVELQTPSSPHRRDRRVSPWAREKGGVFGARGRFGRALTKFLGGDPPPRLSGGLVPERDR